MIRTFLISAILILFTLSGFTQNKAFEKFLMNDSLAHASISFCMMDENGNMISDHNSQQSLTPASTLKLVTSAVAIELLGPGYTFKTMVGYTGKLNKSTGFLSGDIIIKGGGDPTLGSPYFTENYGDFIAKWISDLKKAGIKKIEGRIISDDSYFDYLPVPSKWLWEDAGNYYGAGAYGLSVFDNTYEIHFSTLNGIHTPVITGMIPEINDFHFSNWLKASGLKDRGYVFAAPYSTSGWLSGTVPANNGDFVLKASITDPPLLLARILNKRLIESGVSVSGEPSTMRLEQSMLPSAVIPVSEITSPPIKDIIEVLNHFSVNLYAEHLIKELGKVYKDSASTSAGTEVIYDFLKNAGINTGGIFLEDGSGLSPLDAINSYSIVSLLSYMKNHGKYFNEYSNSLPLAGYDGNLKYYFKDPVFENRFRAKGGSMTRVRSIAGYLKTISGKEVIVCLIVNHYSGSAGNMMASVEKLFNDLIIEDIYE